MSVRQETNRRLCFMKQNAERLAIDVVLGATRRKKTPTAFPTSKRFRGGGKTKPGNKRRCSVKRPCHQEPPVRHSMNCPRTSDRVWIDAAPGPVRRPLLSLLPGSPVSYLGHEAVKHREHTFENRSIAASAKYTMYVSASWDPPLPCSQCCLARLVIHNPCGFIELQPSLQHCVSL